jgi:hypothetical protein
MYIQYIGSMVYLPPHTSGPKEHHLPNLQTFHPYRETSTLPYQPSTHTGHHLLRSFAHTGHHFLYCYWLLPKQGVIYSTLTPLIQVGVLFALLGLQQTRELSALDHLLHGGNHSVNTVYFIHVEYWHSTYNIIYLQRSSFPLIT